MNKILVIFVSLCCYCIIGQSQDLIRNTQRGISHKNQTKKKLRTYELIESRKISDARFIEKNSFEYQKVSPKESYREYVSEAVFLSLNEQLLQKLQTGERDIILNIPVNDERNIELELTRVSITVDDFQIETSNGKSRLDNPGLFYRGVVKGAPFSFAAISIFDDHIRGLIADEDGNYVLGKVGKRGTDYILYNDRNLVQFPDLKCGTTTDDFDTNFPTTNNTESSIPEVGEECVQVYIVCDNAMYDTLGNVGSVTKYALALFHESAIIYFNENIEIEINQIRVWDTPDPWQAETNKCTLKNDFAASTSNFPGYVAHLLSTKPIGGGCASGAAFCDNETHAVTGGLNEFDPFPTYSTEVYLFTHEMGHQLGSPHTQNCVWNGNCTAIDGCVSSVDNENCDPASPSCSNGPVPPSGGGTIMSYCNPGNAPTVGINLANGFGTQPGGLIRANINAANCMDFECDCTDFVNRVLNVTNFLPWTYSASNSISATGGVDRPDHTPVILRTGNYIRLTNFTAHNGSTFLATVGGDICDNNVFFNSPVTNNFIETDNSNKTITETEKKESSDLIVYTQDLRVFPIPFTTNVTIEFNLEESDLVDIKILNVSGQLISNLQSKITMDKGWHKLDYDTTTLPAGVYQLWFQTSKGTTIRKLIRVH